MAGPARGCRSDGAAGAVLGGGASVGGGGGGCSGRRGNYLGQCTCKYFITFYVKSINCINAAKNC